MSVVIESSFFEVNCYATRLLVEAKNKIGQLWGRILTSQKQTHYNSKNVKLVDLSWISESIFSLSLSRPILL